MAVPLLDKKIIKKRVKKLKRPQNDLLFSVKAQYTSIEGTIWLATINLCPCESGLVVQKFLTKYPRSGKKLWTVAQIELVVPCTVALTGG